MSDVTLLQPANPFLIYNGNKEVAEDGTITGASDGTLISDEGGMAACLLRYTIYPGIYPTAPVAGVRVEGDFEGNGTVQGFIYFSDPAGPDPDTGILYGFNFFLPEQAFTVGEGGSTLHLDHLFTLDELQSNPEQYPYSPENLLHSVNDGNADNPDSPSSNTVYAGFDVMPSSGIISFSNLAFYLISGDVAPTPLEATLSADLGNVSQMFE